MKFDQWLHEDNGFGSRIDRIISDIKLDVAENTTDEIMKWLIAAYTVGHGQGYDAGYYDASEEAGLT